jgi:hypothetical protein
VTDYNPTNWQNNVTPINATNLNKMETAIDQVEQTQRERSLKRVLVATTASITLSGEQTIDGVSVVAGNRVLVKNQGTASQNGIYSVSTGAWSRAGDADTATEFPGGTLITVERGTTNGGKAFVLSTNTAITIGTTALNFGEVGGGTSAATDTTRGAVKLSTAAADVNDPIALGPNDSRVLTQDENNAAQGTQGAPSDTNRYVTDQDGRLYAATGDFQALFAYSANDLFQGGGATFRVKQAWTSGATAPDPEAGNTADYEVWAAPGEAGAPAIMITEDELGLYADLDVAETKVIEDSFGVYVDLDAFSGSAGGGASALDDLTDVDLQTEPPSPGDVLEWTGLRWVPSTRSRISPLHVVDPSLITAAYVGSPTPAVGMECVADGVIATLKTASASAITFRVVKCETPGSAIITPTQVGADIKTTPDNLFTIPAASRKAEFDLTANTADILARTFADDDQVQIAVVSPGSGAGERLGITIRFRSIE